MFDTLINRVCVLAQERPNETAVIFKNEILTWRALLQRAVGISGWLGDHGVTRGDAVCFSAVSRPEMVAVYLAVQLCGAVAVFLDKNATSEHMAQICSEVGGKLLLTDKPMKEYGEGLQVASLRAVYASTEGCACNGVSPTLPDRDSLAELLFTTGTTGRPKGVMLSWRAVYNILKNTIDGIHITEETVLLLPLPLNHSFALRVLRAVLYSGGTVVLQNGFTFAKEAENNILNHHCNAMACVPASYEVLKSQMQDAFAPILSSLKFLEFSAGSLSIQQRREITELLPSVQIYNTWGSSESGGAIFCDVNAVAGIPEKAGTLGRPLPGRTDVRFLDNAAPLDTLSREPGSLSKWFVETDSAHPGRMVMKGDMQMSGYWHNPEETAAALIDGWLVTGDMAYRDADGDIFMLGRADDIINVGGEKVSPIEVENTAGQYAYIHECACIGVEDPDGVLGHVPILFAVTKQGYSEAAFVQWLAGRMERFKLPRKYVQVMELPRNRMQKIDRKALRRMWENQDAIALMNPVVEAILSRRSIRRFADQEIPRQTLNMLVRCGYSAPSGHNMQSWRFTVLTRQADIARLKQAAGEAAKANQVIMYGFENPKAMILVSNDSRNPDGCQDASCAAENIMLAAHSYGIGSVWLNMLMKLRNAEPVKAVLDDFGIPKGHTVWASVALGYPVAEGIRLKKKEDVVVYVGDEHSRG